MKPDQVERQEQESERLWKTPNTLDSEGRKAADEEPRPVDVEEEDLEDGEDSPDSQPETPPRS